MAYAKVISLLPLQPLHRYHDPPTVRGSHGNSEQLTRVETRKKQRPSVWILLLQSFFPVLFNPSPSHSNNKNECVTVRFLKSALHILSGGYNSVFRKSLILTVLKSELRPANTFVEKPCEEKHLQERVVKLKDKVKSHMDLKSKLRRAKNGQKGRES